MTKFSTFLAVFLVACFAADAAMADPITAVIAAVQAFAATSATAAFIVRIGISLVLSALSAALAPKPGSPRAPGIKTESTTTGGTNPQTFILGTYATAGNMVAPPYSHPNSGDVPNQFLTYVVDVSDLPGVTFSRLMVAGEYVTDLVETSLREHDLEGMEFEGAPHLFMTWHDGSQTTADNYMMAEYSDHPDRPWSADMVGTGVAYAVLTFKYNRTLFNQLPGVRFEVDGIPLYDPRLDSTAGGSGSQRWANPATWAQTGNPMVMVYNILRGITLPDGRHWGGSVAADDLPLDNWFAALNECDVVVALEGGGSEPQYCAGLEVSLSDAPAAVIEELLKACSAEITEFGGVYKVRVGPPALPVYFFTDDDVVADKPRSLAPYPGLDGVHNAIHAAHPSPAALWETRDAPPRYNAEWEAEDGGRQLVAEVDLSPVASDTQVQRLMAAWIEDERRFRRHSLTLPPEAAVLEPLDCVAWTSTREGYTNKVFEVGEISDDLATVLQTVAIRERDAGDFVWLPGDAILVQHPSTVVTLPVARALQDFDLLPHALLDADSNLRRPALRLVWDGTKVAAPESVEFQVQLANAQPVAAGYVSTPSEGEVIVSAGILPATVYRARARVIARQGGGWTDWESVATADVRLGDVDLDSTVQAQLATADAVRADHDALVAGFDGVLADLHLDYEAAVAAAQDSEAFSLASGNAALTAAAEALAAASSATNSEASRIAADLAAGNAATGAGNSAAAQAAAEIASGEAQDRAIAAASSATNSEASRIAAELAAGNAATGAGNSTAAQAAAEAAQAAAETARGQAQTSATASGNSATAAAGSASTSATSATEAAASAVVSEGQALEATTAASAAAQTAALAGPAILAAPAAQWTRVSQYDNASILKNPADAADFVTDDADFGAAYEFPGNTNLTIGLAYPVAWHDSAVHELRVRFKVADDGTLGPLDMRLGATVQLGTTRLDINQQSATFYAAVADGVVEVVAWFSRRASAAMPTLPAGVLYIEATSAADGGDKLYPHLRQNYQDNTDGVVRLGTFEVRDITAHVDAMLAEDAALGSATASATSASAAAASETAAATEASAAETSRLAAETAKGAAEVAETAAAASKTTAAGSASAAQASQVLAANSASNAGSSASAAATSASAAATSATDAGTEASAAEASRLAAETAQGGAEVAETAATASKNTAAGSASAAATSATTAATSATDAATALEGAEGAAGDAQGAAEAATTSATAAATSATNAGTSATAANQSKIDAVAARDNAASSATAAATSATSAASHATDAGDYATVASGQALEATTAASAAAQTAALAGPAILAAPAAQWTRVSQYDNASILKNPADAADFVTDDADFGAAYEFPGNTNLTIGLAYPVAWHDSAVHELRVRFKVADDGTLGPLDMRLGATVQLGTTRLDINQQSATFYAAVADGVVEVVAWFSRRASAAMPTLPAGVLYIEATSAADGGDKLYPHLRQNYQDNTDGVVRLGTFEVRDITAHVDAMLAEDAALGSATASATSASAAAASETAAATEASAAETSRLAAETAKGAAEVAETAAAASKTTAAGSASAAQASQVLAANSASNAGSSASAAATSASAAATSATDAGTEASAAEASRLAAETAQGGAEVAETAATASKNTAAGSASAAATSATTAATSATDAATALEGAEGAAGDAQGAAEAATTSATAAATSATNAGTSATAANQSKIDAVAARDNAASSATAAATSATSAASHATDAGDFATAASGQALEATTAAAAAARTAALAGPAILAEPAEQWTRISSEASASILKTGANPDNFVTDDADFGAAYEFPSGTNLSLGHAYPAPWHDNAVHEIRARFKVVDNGTLGPLDLRLGATVQLGATRLESNRQTASFFATVADGVVEVVAWFSRRASAAMPTLPAGVLYIEATAAADGGDKLYPHLRQNYGSNTDGVVRLGTFEVRDITAHVDAMLAEDAALGSATASATSASAAAASETAAATEASAAETSRLAAETAKGGAESARDAAVVSKNTAAGSASAAATSATNAATSKTDAGDYATAASTSASAAATSALNAVGSASAAATNATAASGHVDAAAIQAGNAATSASAAALSAGTASTEAAAAAVSATVAAGVLTEINISATDYQRLITGVDALDGVGDAETATTGGAAFGQAGTVITATGSGETINATGVPSGLQIMIPAAQAGAFGGRRVRVDILARPANSWPAAGFSAAYATNDNGNSGRNDFTLSAGWAWYSFYYEVPVPDVGGVDWIGLWGDSALTDKQTEFARVVVRAAPLADDIPELGVVAADVTVMQGAVADLEGNAAASWVARVAAGGASAGLEMVAADDPVNGPQSSILFNADNLIMAGTTRARHLVIDENLDIDAATGAFRMGKTSPADHVNDGIFLGRTNEGGGATGFGFNAGRTSGGAQQYISMTKADGLKIKNADFLIGSGAGTEATKTTSQTIDLPAGTKTINLELIGGGGGGGGSIGPYGGTANPGGAGGDTVVVLKDGTTTKKTWTADGGAGGAGASVSGNIGLPGGVSAGSPRGDGGRGANSAVEKGNTGQSGAGGQAGDFITVAGHNVANLSDPKLVITIGGAGSSGTGTYENGTAGTGGQVKYTHFADADIDAAPVAIKPSAVGTFTVTAGEIGTFPVLSPTRGFWYLSNLPAGFRPGIGSGTRLIVGDTAAFISPQTPTWSNAATETKTVNYQFFPM